jgi:hypothetical protein
MEMDTDAPKASANAKVVVITNLTRNVVQEHLKIVFGHYGEIAQVDLPVYGRCAFRSSQLLSHPTQRVLQLARTEARRRLSTSTTKAPSRPSRT